jgi:Domain of unknown function (DUF6484)
MNLQNIPAEARVANNDDALTPLLSAPMRSAPLASASMSENSPKVQAVHVGKLLALADAGNTPIVDVGGTSSRARSTVDLHAAHIGKSVVLMYEDADPTRPIVMGVLRETMDWPMHDKPEHVQVDADGQRIVVNAKQQLVLRCGKASITLTQAGKVLIEGNYVLSKSSGVNRIKGGSVQLN